ncbi:MAG: flagellar biosynthetic protein FlhB [bacterium]|nr:MAG: flagellar biosynthetic protein FlhB [bacterium]
MAEDDKDQRTETATEKRREETFKKGRTPHSKEVSSTFVLMAALFMLYTTGANMRMNIAELMTTAFTTSGSYELNVSTIQPVMFYYMKMLGKILGPLMAGIAVSGIIASLLQNGGFVLSIDPLKPKFSKLNPLKGFARFFSRQAFVELIKSLFKVSIVGYLCYLVLKNEWGNLPGLSDQGIEQTIWFIASVSVKLIFYVLLLMLILAVIDFAFQKYLFEENLRMTKQEVKDERKETEGNPLIKQRIRSIQMQLARRRMMSEVPKAEVVITNPTHLAVALSYDRLNMPAPTLVAKGAGHIARKIKEIAKENDIPIVEDRPLARILFKSVDIGQSIPEDLYKATAEILAYIYRLKGKVL